MVISCQVALSVLLLASFSTATAQNGVSEKGFKKLLESCEHDKDIDTQIESCTSAIEVDEVVVGSFFNPQSAYVPSATRVGLYAQRGNLYGLKGEYSLAIKDLTRAIQIDPKDAQAFAALGQAHLMIGNLDSAISGATESIRLNPADKRPWHVRASAYIKKNDHQDAIADLNEVIRIDPLEVQAFHERSMEFLATWNYKAALADTNEVIRLNPQDSGAFGLRGTLHAAMQQCDLAVPDFNEAIRLDAARPSTFTERGNCYWMVGNDDSAIHDYSEALRLEPIDSTQSRYSLYVKRGVVRLYAGRYALAITDFNRAIALNNTSAEAFYNRGLAYDWSHDDENALRDYSEAIRLAPTSERFSPTVRRSRIYTRTSNPQAAKLDFEAAFGTPESPPVYNPVDAEGYLLRADGYSTIERDSQAVRAFEEALRLQPPRDLQIASLAGLGYSHMRPGQYRLASAEFEQILESTPNDPYPYFVIFRYLSLARASKHPSNAADMFGFLNGMISSSDPIKYLDKTQNDAKTPPNPADVLEKYVEKVDLSKWPGQVIQFYRGKTTSEDLLGAARNADPNTDREQHCEAYFYLAEQALLLDKRAEAIELFRKTLATKVTNFVEYSMAARELKTLAQSGAD